MARVRVRDPLPDPAPPHTTLTAVERDVLEGHLSPMGAMLVRCLLLRAAFGGMPGDVRMLKDYAAVWHARLLNTPGQHGVDWLGRLQSLFAALPNTQYEPHAVQAVELLDVPLSAVDFHVCSIVDELAGCHGVTPIV